MGDGFGRRAESWVTVSDEERRGWTIMATAWERGPDPPWVLVSDSGVAYHVRDDAALDRLINAGHLRSDHAKQLVGRQPTTSRKLPQHRSNWQLLQKVKWLQRADGASKDIIYIVGDAKHHIENMAMSRQDTRHFVGQAVRVQSLLNESLQSNGLPTDVYARKGVPFKWRLIKAPPDRLERIPCVQRPSEFASIQASCQAQSMFEWEHMLQ